MEKLKPFYVEDFAIEEFYSVEYVPVRKKVNKQSLFVLGTNSTGKSTTFDAIIYAIFGYDFVDRPIKIADTKIILSNGDISIEITRKYNTEPKIRISTSNEEIRGSDQVNQKICELLNLPEKRLDAKRLIDAFKVPQKDEDSLIMKYKTKLETIILSFLNIFNLDEKIQLIELKEKDLNNQLEILKIQKGEIQIEIEDLSLKERKNKNFYAEIREFIDQFESGEIKKTIKALNDNEEIGKRAKELISLKTKKSQELFENGSKISRMREYYNKELLEVLKETISVLICPVCGDKVSIHTIVSRKNRSVCPFCGNEQYDGEIYQVLKKEITYASENFEKLLTTEYELKKDLEIIKFEIDKINKEKLKVNLNSVILRILENSTEEEIENEYRKLKLDLEKYEYSINDSSSYIEELSNKLKDVEKIIESIPKEIDDLLTLKRRICDEKNSTVLNYFNEKLNTIFGKLVYPLPYKLRLENGHLLLNTGSSIKDCSDKFAIALSDKKLIDIALWHTILITNLENNIVNINFGLIDDIFENIDNSEITRKENLYSVLNSLKKQSQIIVFSINKNVNENLQFEEQKLQVQTKISKW